MADDERESGRTFQSERGPLRRDITYEELAALIAGASIEDVLEKQSAEQHEPEPAQDIVGQAPAEPVLQDPIISDVPAYYEESTASDAPIFEPVSEEPVQSIEVREFADPYVKDVPNSVTEIVSNELAAEPMIEADEAPEEMDDSVAEPVVDEQSEAKAEFEEEIAEDDLDVPLDDGDSATGRLIRGSLWMTLGSIGSRILGAIYVIPWVAMIGATYSTSANSLYAQGYQIYSVFLLIATAGLPNVLARLVAEYQAKRDFRTVKRVFRQSMILGAIMGIVAGILLFVLSGLLSQGHENVVRVLHALALAIVVIPTLSMLRGFVQGFEFMGISALSQFIEQVVRVIYMLALTYYIMVAGNGNWIDATVQSTLAAFWGAIAGIIVILIGIARKRHFFESQEVLGARHTEMETGEMMRRMVRQAMPVVFASSAVALVQVFDQYTFFHIIKAFTNFTYETADNMFAQFSFNSNKLVMLLVAVAVAVAETALPMMARAKAEGDKTEIGQQITQALRLLAFVLVPASLGMSAIAHPMYAIFYGTSDMANGILVLAYAAFTSLVLGLYMVVLAILQGLGDLRYTMKMLGTVLLVKAILQVPLTIWLAGMGPLVATMFAFAFGLYFAMRRLGKEYPINWVSLNYSLMTIIFWSIFLFLIVSPVVSTIELFISSDRLPQFVAAFVGALLGGAIYGIAALRTNLAQDVLGERAARLREKLHL
jgi:O-antigen/teichoic acid export membrane protein